MKWYVWACNECTSTMSINYDATEEDYNRFKHCVCSKNGILEWQYNYEDENEVD